MSLADAFEPLRSALERAGVRYAVGGSWASTAFGEELDRAILLTSTGLSSALVPFVTPEDILLAKLHWFRSGGEVSAVQWRDVEGIVRGCAAILDRRYLELSAAKLGVHDLLGKALREA